MSGMPVQLGVACHGPDCEVVFEADFMVAEDSTPEGRLRLVLNHADAIGWRVIWRRPLAESLTYCPHCSRVWDVKP